MSLILHLNKDFKFDIIHGKDILPGCLMEYWHSELSTIKEQTHPALDQYRY